MSTFEVTWEHPEGVIPIVGSLHALVLCKRKWLRQFFKAAQEDPGLWDSLERRKHTLKYILVTASVEHEEYIVKLTAVRSDNYVMFTHEHRTGLYPR